MTRNAKHASRPRPSYADRVMLWLSSGKDIDGLWVGTYFQSNSEAVMGRVEAALGLIKAHDRSRYERLARDLDRVWVRLLTTGVAQFDPSLRACLVDERFVLAETTDIAHIAAVIAHEATHARLWRQGFGYDEAVRQRVEAICLRREVALAQKLPDGARIRQWADDALAMSPDYWTNAAAVDREHAGSVEVLDHLGHGWLARLTLAVRKWRQASATQTTASGESQ
jgi:hypothetical protein